MSAALLAKLIEAGTPAALVGEVAMELARAQAVQEAADNRKAKDRERKRVPRNSVDSAEIAEPSEIHDKGSLKVSPPAPPLPKTSKSPPFNSPIVLEEKAAAVGSCLRKAFPAAPFQRFFDAWNTMAAKHGLPLVEGAAGKRLKALKARISEHGEDAVLRAIANVAKSPHWLGENGWLGNFDSLLRPDNFQRMLENTYCGKQEAQRITDPKVLAANKRANADLYDKMGRTAEAIELRREADRLEQKAAA